MKQPDDTLHSGLSNMTERDDIIARLHHLCPPYGCECKCSRCQAADLRVADAGKDETIAELRAKLAGVRQALSTYGQHLLSCDIFGGRKINHCSCGFYAARGGK